MNRLTPLFSIAFYGLLFAGCASSTPRGQVASERTEADKAPSTQNEPAPADEVIVENPGKGEALALRLNPPPGASWTYRTDVDTQQVGVESYTLRTEMEQAVAAKRTQGGVEVTVTITDVTMKAKEPQFQQQTDELARMMKGIQTVAVYDSRAYTDGAKSTGGAGIPAMIAAAQAGVPVGLFGLLYPEQPVAVGATWTGRYEMQKAIENMARASGAAARVPKGASHPIQYRLESVRLLRGRKIAEISFTLAGETQAELTIPVMDPSGGTTHTKIDTTSFINGKGKAQVDVETGMPIRVEMEQRTTVESQGIKNETLMKSKMWRED